MPGAAVRVGLGVGHLGQGAVDGAALLRRRRAVYGRAHQRVQKGHPLADREQPLGLVRRRRLDAEPIRRAPHEDGIVGRLRRHQQQQQPGVLGQRVELPQEALLDPPRQRLGLQQPEPAGQLRRGQPARQLEDRQRVAVRLGDEPVAAPVVEPGGDDGREQGARVRVGEPAERQLGQADELALVCRRARCEHERDRLGQQPARDEPEDLARGVVEPLDVVDEAQQRSLRGDLGQQVQRGQSDQEAVGGRAGRQSQRHAERGLLGLRQRSQPVEHRRAELVQPRERQLHLGLDAGDARDAEPGCLAGAVVQ